MLNESVVEEQFARVLKMAWFFGYDPAFQRVKHLPNGLALLKFLCNGEIACLPFEVRSLVPALRTWLKKDTFGIDEVGQLIASFGRDELAELKRHSCKMIALTLAPEQLLYIPTGWIIAGRVVKRQPHLRAQENAADSLRREHRELRGVGRPPCRREKQVYRSCRKCLSS